MLVRRISPAPRSWASASHAPMVSWVRVRPASTATRIPYAGRRTSTARTTHWLPNRVASSVMSSGRRTAAEFTATLSHPAMSRASASATVRMPPPTVNGMNTSRATAATILAAVSRFSMPAVMSRNTSSSAPSAP